MSDPTYLTVYIDALPDVETLPAIAAGGYKPTEEGRAPAQAVASLLEKFGLADEDDGGPPDPENLTNTRFCTPYARSGDVSDLMTALAAWDVDAHGWEDPSGLWDGYYIQVRDGAQLSYSCNADGMITATINDVLQASDDLFGDNPPEGLDALIRKLFAPDAERLTA